MQWAETIVLIVLIVTIGRVLRARYGDTPDRRDKRLKQKDLVREEPASTAEATRLRGEVERLNDRIKVLERLATDPARRLADEIDSLKDR
jgi:predicted nuclease with TOPRIM domain